MPGVFHALHSYCLKISPDSMGASTEERVGTRLRCTLTLLSDTSSTCLGKCGELCTNLKLVV